MVHRDPFHCSASMSFAPPRAVELPTAVHAVVEAQDKPSIRMVFVPPGLGIRRLVQSWPFHRAANGTAWLPRAVKVPTTVEAFTDDRHEIPSRVTFLELAGRGAALIVHSRPFQRSTSAPCAHLAPEALQRLPYLNDPTATHVVADVHETALSDPNRQPGRTAIFLAVHRRPFQAIGLRAPSTAMHTRADAHDTPLKSPSRPYPRSATRQRTPFQRNTIGLSKQPDFKLMHSV